MSPAIAVHDRQPRRVDRRAVVVGVGTMGSGIAAVLARARYDVAVVDADLGRAAAGVEHGARLLGDAVRHGKASALDVALARDRLHAAESLDELAGPIELVIEAVPEQVALKRRILREAEEHEPSVLASNTSGLSIDELATGLRRPERFIGLHFFNPVPASALVEVVVGARTSGATRERALEVVRRLDKEAVVVRNAPGFATTRLGVLQGLEAIRMVEQGVATAQDIDRAIELGYRHPVGPLRLTDLVGLDVRLDIARNLATAYGPRFEPPPLLERMVADGRLGRKVGRGFYEWPAL